MTRNALPILSSVLMLSPAILLFYFIHVFGVNVVYWDDWSMIWFFQRMITGSLSLPDLVAQAQSLLSLHNEHWIFFPRIAMLAISWFTRFDTTSEMFFSWILLCLTGLMLFRTHKRGFSRSSSHGLLLAFLPASLLLFTLKQYESILWGFTCQIYMMIFSVVSAIYLLEASKKLDFRFILAVLAAVVASFSFALGLNVWPAGLLHTLLMKRKSRLGKAGLWCAVAGLIVVYYLLSYVKPSNSPPLDYALESPIGALRFLVRLVGATFATDSSTAGAFGLALVLVGAIITFYGYRSRILGREAVWLSLIVFALLSAVAITVGRGGYGQALSSRYTPVIVLGMTALFLLSISVIRNSHLPGKSFGAHALLTLILVSMIVTSGQSWQAGQDLRDSRAVGAYVLRTYKIQSDENLFRYLYLSPNASALRLRYYASFLESNGLSVFGEAHIDPSTLTAIESPKGFFFLDTINGRQYSLDSPIVIDQKKESTITIMGWAVDEQAGDLASAVFLCIDGGTDLPTCYGLQRPGIAEYFGNSKLHTSGFLATFSSTILESGHHTIQVKVVARDGSRYYLSSDLFTFRIE